MRRLLAALALAACAASASAQVVEQPRTWTGLLAAYPCVPWLSGRIARVTDAQSSSSVGGGGGSAQVWVQCDGVDTWSLVTIGGSGGGVSGLTACDAGTAIADNAILRGDSTNKCQGSAVTVADTTGNLQWEGATADDFEGNFTFADPTADWTWAWGAAGDLVGAGSFSIDNLKLDGNTLSSTDTNGNITLTPNGSGLVTIKTDAFIVNSGGGIFTSSAGLNGFYVSNDNRLAAYLSDGTQLFGAKKVGASDYRLSLGATSFLVWVPSGNAYDAQNADTGLARAAAGVVSVTDGSTGGGALHLNPLASPPRTCDATGEGDIYSDTSHALCWCDGSAWQKLSGAGTCA